MKLRAEITTSNDRKRQKLVLFCLSCPGWPRYEGDDAHVRLAAHYREQHPPQPRSEHAA